MKYENPDIESSYRENDIGRTLYELVLDLKPKTIVEFGVLNGYSTVAMAMALEELGRGKIYGYDLWGKYQFKHSTMSNAYNNIQRYGLQDYVELLYGDIETWTPFDYDLMHIDISNDGDKLSKAVDKVKSFGGNIVFEGGTSERDNVEWMKKYEKIPICSSGLDYDILNYKFPSLSIIK